MQNEKTSASEGHRIEIHGRRWFQRTYGNTYHSVRVYVDGELVGHCPFAYGYGDQYKQTAHALLQEAGIYPKTGEMLPSGAQRDYTEFLTDTINHRERFTITVTDVDRKRDL